MGGSVSGAGRPGAFPGVAVLPRITTSITVPFYFFFDSLLLIQISIGIYSILLYVTASSEFYRNLRLYEVLILTYHCAWETRWKEATAMSK